MLQTDRTQPLEPGVLTVMNEIIIIIKRSESWIGVNKLGLIINWSETP